MQPGSQRSTSELNNALDVPSDERCLSVGWIAIQHSTIKCARVSGMYDGGDAFVTNRYTHVSGDAEGLP
jgi:hypothetical protein